MTPIDNPHTVPIARRCDDEPSLPDWVMQPEVLRTCFAQRPDVAWEMLGAPPSVQCPEGLRGAIPAAVLVPLMLHPKGLTVLLTQRAQGLRHHANQVGLPGGCAEPGDLTAVATALREAKEEIGLALQAVEVIGTLPFLRTGSGFGVIPVLGLVSPDVSLKIDTAEVQDTFEVPLNFLMTPAHHCVHELQGAQPCQQFFSMTWWPQDTITTSRRAQAYCIWGATAAILRSLYVQLTTIIGR